MKKYFGVIIFIICVSFAGAVQAQKKPYQYRVTLGRFLFKDQSFSAGQNQSCKTCHHPEAKFADPANRISPMYRPVSEGSVVDGNGFAQFGSRNAPSAAYAASSPPFYWDDTEGLFIGGLFQDGRASGIAETATGGMGAGPTYDPLADQAKGPFGSPVEMALVPIDNGDGSFTTTEQRVVEIFKTVPYRGLYKKAFGVNVTKDTVDNVYNNLALAISAFEKSRKLNRFNSKFDQFRREQGLNYLKTLTDANAESTLIKSKVYNSVEIEGFRLFNGKGQCTLCHTLDRQSNGKPTVLTDFSYDNLGIPVNPVIADLSGKEQPTDYGLGAQVAILQAANPEAQTIELLDGTVIVDGEQGKFKVSSLRNVALTAPYGHNGFFPTLYDIVHFYNTRDVGYLTDGGLVSEVPETVNHDELGDLGLSFDEEQKIVVFLETLTDR